ncbi:MAG: serine/threonine-protein kinase [Planctomycetota bacterium]
MTDPADSEPTRVFGPPATATPLPGAQVSASFARLGRGSLIGGRFRLEEELRSSAHAAVWSAHDLLDGRDVTLKLQPQLGAEEVARLRRGEQVLLGLHHPSLLEVVSLGEERGVEYLATRGYPGARDLEQVAAERGPVPSAEALPWVIGVLEGLSLLHGRGVVHRDVKPANVLLTREGGTVLIDFDLAKPVSNAADSGVFDLEALLLNAGETHAGLPGTPVYMSRERLGGEPAAPADDVFAAALTVYRLVSGHLPSDHGAPPTNLEALRAARLRHVPLETWGVAAPAALEQVLARALSAEVSRRYPSAVALGDALNGLLLGDRW